MIRCSMCKELKELHQFSSDAARRSKRQSYCKECTRAYCRAHYRKHKAQHNRRRAADMRRYKARNRRFIMAFLQNSACIDCGESDPIVLELDHRREKEHDVSVMISAGFSLESIRTEIAKCEVRCANCHRRRTAVQLGWYRAKLWAAEPALPSQLSLISQPRDSSGAPVEDCYSRA